MLFVGDRPSVSYVGKKKIKSDKNKKPMKKYYIKGDEKHYVWVKWKSGFEDKPDIVWSAEPQGIHFC